MRCSISLTRYRGALLSAEEAAASAGTSGELSIREEVDQVRKRSTLVARVRSETVYGKKGSTRLPAREVFRPLFDVRLLHAERNLLVLTGIERTTTEPVTEYAQTWRVTLAP
jgi:hypothetical protein